MFNIKKCGFDTVQTVIAIPGMLVRTLRFLGAFVFLGVNPTNCDWFLRLDGKLLMLKFSSIMQDFNWRV